MTEMQGRGRLAHAPADHPAVKPGRVGVLIANLGTPDHYDYWSMRSYLNEFLSDERVIDLPRWKWQPLLQLIILTKRPFSSGKNYKSIWNHDKGESPLMTITRDQTTKMAEVMAQRYGDRVMVDFCMRYGNPSTKSKVREMVAAGCERILFVPLYPHYAGATSATANDQFFRALMEETWQPAARTIAPYFDDPAYIEALARSVEEAYGKAAKRPDILVVSYHGMPKRYLMQGDPYHCHCHKTTRLVREKMGWDETFIRTTFQSRFGPQEWLQPYTDKTLEALPGEGVKKIAVAAPAFISDCLETLEEIAMQGKDSFIEAGGTDFAALPCLNDSKPAIDLLEILVKRELGGWI